MTPEQKILVRESYRKVAALGDDAGVLFYNRLFECDPQLRSLFQGTVNERAHSLMTTVTVAVQSLDRLETLAPTLRAMGARHAIYGVRPEHYAAGAEVLLWTLERALGADFTPALRAAWGTTYATITDMMQSEELLPV